MEPRVSIITLGVKDVVRSRALYESLGFKSSSAYQESVTFFDGGGVVLGLYGRGPLAEDATVQDSAPGFPVSHLPTMRAVKPTWTPCWLRRSLPAPS